MIIGGLEKLSLIDYPEKVSAIVFTTGCNFRCQFCHNPSLVWPQDNKGQSSISHEQFLETKDSLSSESVRGFFNFLKERQGKLDAVVITGGEPTMQPDLLSFMKEIKDLGFLVKLDSNGTRPEVIQLAIDQGLVDYLAMDIKAPLAKYSEVVGINSAPLFKNVLKSAKIIISSGLPYEFRSTLVPGLFDKSDLAGMAEIIHGAKKWYLQKFRSETDLVNPEYRDKKGFKDTEMEEFVLEAKKYIQDVSWR